MAFHLRAAYDKTVEIYATVLGEPWRSLRFASALVWPFLALSLFVTPVVTPGDEVAGEGGNALLVLLHSLLVVYVSVALAVRWHRYVLLGEDVAGWTALPLGWRELRYLGRSLLVVLVCIVAALLAFGLLRPVLAPVAAGSGVHSTIMVTIGLVAAFLLVTFVIARFALALPATAVDRRTGLVDSWNLTREHWRPFWILLVLVSIPEALAMTAIDWTFAGSTSPVVRGAASLGREAVFLAGVAAYAIALSSNYLAATGGSLRPNGEDPYPA